MDMRFKRLFANMPEKTRGILIVECVIGIAIIVGGIFVLTINSRVPTQLATPLAGISTYVSSPLQVTFQYPSTWQIDPVFNGIPGIERYQGSDGYFQVDATNDPTKRSGRLIIHYPKTIKLGTTTYRYFVLYADASHLKSIGDTVEFMNKP